MTVLSAQLVRFRVPPSGVTFRGARPLLHGHSPQTQPVLPIASTVGLSLGTIGFFFLSRLPKVGTETYQNVHSNPGLVLYQDKELEFD